MNKTRTHILFLILLLPSSFSFSAQAWVDLKEWKKPKVFDLSPGADTAMINTTRQSHRSNPTMLQLNKTNASALGLYPLVDTLVAGVNFGGSWSELKNIPWNSEQKRMTARGSYIELAALYALSDTHSVYVSPGVSFKTAKIDEIETQERYAALTAYTVWAVDPSLGLGVGLSARKNSRTQTLVPLVGGAWQLSEDVRIDGWLPANLHARWKLTPSQAIFTRLELAGESALTQIRNQAGQSEIQLLGGQFLLGYSLSTPIGFGTGRIRIDPSIGFFKGKLSQKELVTQTKRETTPPVAPLADVRIAVAF